MKDTASEPYREFLNSLEAEVTTLKMWSDASPAGVPSVI